MALLHQETYQENMENIPLNSLIHLVPSTNNYHNPNNFAQRPLVCSAKFPCRAKSISLVDYC